MISCPSSTQATCTPDGSTGAGLGAAAAAGEDRGVPSRDRARSVDDSFVTTGAGAGAEFTSRDDEDVVPVDTIFGFFGFTFPAASSFNLQWTQAKEDEGRKKRVTATTNLIGIPELPTEPTYKSIDQMQQNRMKGTQYTTAKQTQDVGQGTDDIPVQCTDPVTAIRTSLGTPPGLDGCTWC